MIYMNYESTITYFI